MTVTPQTIIEFLRAIVAAALSMPEIKAILAQIAINVIVAVSVAVHGGTYNLSKTAEFLYRKVLPYTAVFFICKLAGNAAGLGWVAPAAWALLEMTLLGDLSDNLIKLGIPIPENIARWIVKPSAVSPPANLPSRILGDCK